MPANLTFLSLDNKPIFLCSGVTPPKGFPMSPPPKHFPGDQYGSWTLVSRVGKDRWLSRCKCGSEQEVYLSNLTRNRSTRCLSCRYRKLPPREIRWEEPDFEADTYTAWVNPRRGKKGKRVYIEFCWSHLPPERRKAVFWLWLRIKDVTPYEELKANRSQIREAILDLVENHFSELAELVSDGTIPRMGREWDPKQMSSRDAEKEKQ